MLCLRFWILSNLFSFSLSKSRSSSKCKLIHSIHVSEDPNLLITLGTLSKVTNSTSHKYKVDCDEVVNMFASQGIQMVKPIRFDPERLARLEWNISKFLESEKQILVPEEAMIYKDKLGKEFLRFNTYDKKQFQK